MSKAQLSERAERYLSRRDRPTLEDAVAFEQEPREVQVEVLAELRARAADDSWSGVIGFVALAIAIFGALFGTATNADSLPAYVVTIAVVAAILIGLVLWVARMQSTKERSVAWLGALEDELRRQPQLPQDGVRRDPPAPAPVPEPQPLPVVPVTTSTGSIEVPAAAHRADPGAPAETHDDGSDAADAHAGRHRGGPTRRSVRRSGE